METRTQLRAVCPHCFAQQAIRKSGRLVAHGYTRPQHWHSNQGTCRGASAPHFGTEAGRDYTAKLAETLLKQADDRERTADEVVAGTAPVMTTKRVASRLVMEVVKENPTELDRADYARSLRQKAVYERKGAAELRETVAKWQPAEPVLVTVEAKGAPLVHLYSKRMGGKACAASMMGAQRGGYNNVSDESKVTCPKCLDRIARLAAQKDGAK